MSASIATAICATSCDDVAVPAVFHVMTRMLSSVFAGRLSLPIPRESRITPFAPAARSMTRVMESANARSGRMIASRRARTTTAAIASIMSPRNDTICAIG